MMLIFVVQPTVLFTLCVLRDFDEMRGHTMNLIEWRMLLEGCEYPVYGVSRPIQRRQ